MNARFGLILWFCAATGLAFAAGGCAEAGRATDTGVTVLAGWYSKSPSQARIQPCGQARSLQVADSVELATRAEDFGLMDGDPVYVRLAGTERDGRFDVVRVEQFGSPVPIRDCPMHGLTIQSAAPAGS